MPRILGVDIPNDKKISISLRYLYGIGPQLSLELCERTGVDPDKRSRELTDDELREGGRLLATKLRRYRPRYLAVLGIGAYRTAFGNRKAALGLQPKPIEQTAVWVLPNPSGLNANYQIDDLAKMFAKLRETALNG